MTEPKRPRGRPRKVRPGEAETPSTVVAPVAETSENPVDLSPVETLDPMTTDVIVGPVEVAIADAMTDAAVAREFRPARALTDLQRTAWATDVWDAYQAQDEIKRTDALNRVWTFRYEVVKGHTHMLVEAKRGQQVSQQLILSSQMTMERALEAVDAADRETA